MITLENKMAGGSNHLAGLHALRGFAAVMVFFFHLHFVGQIPLPKSWGLIASHGGMGVELFFVLSAFSLLYSNQKYVKLGGSEWVSSFLIKRFFRIAPLFYIMLIVYCALTLFTFNGKLDIQKIIINLLFIFNFAPKEAQGIVWASWSIGVEMVFYAFLPIIILSVRSLRAAVLFWIFAGLASVAFRHILETDSAVPPGYSHYAFMSQLGVFSSGVLGYWAFEKIKFSTEILKHYLWWITCALGAAILIFLFSDSAIFLINHGRSDLQLWGLVFGLISALSAFSAKRWMSNQVLQHLGERSYSIYLTHAAIIYFSKTMLGHLYAIIYPYFGGYGFALCAFVALIPTLVVAEFTYRFIEVPGISLGRKFALLYSKQQ